MRRPHLAALVLGFAFLVANYELAMAQEDESTEGEKKEKPAESNTLKVLGSYALVVVGATVIGIAVAKTFSSNLSYPQARLMLVNFLRANPYQAEMIAKRMEGTFGEAIAAALKIGGMTGTDDPAAVAQATAPTYDATGQAVVTKWGISISKAKLAAAAAVAGAAIAISEARVVPVIVAVLALLGFLRLFLYKNEVESNIIRARAELLPEVDRACASGRFVTQLPNQPR
ncbi:MAG: hypothetical protein SFX73_36510 [Kofleriaceae bacterium]|nr:hypothetical protein [Kofleriaceae bacterium]